MAENKTARAEVITIGDEILYGQINDTNSQWLGEKLSEIGIPVIQKTSIGDSREVILATLKAASERAEVIITTGGLGPTKDDITKKTIAEFFGTPIRYRQPIFDHVKELLEKHGLTMDELNATQAELPESADAIMNHWGTAPGMWFEAEGKVWINMPGVPREMKAMMNEICFPRLQKHFKTLHISHKIIRTVGIPESKLAPLLNNWASTFPANLKLAYLPRIAEVRLRLSVSAPTAEETLTVVKKYLASYPEVAKPYTYAFEDEEIEETVGKLLLENGETLATAESCTGGLIANKITNIAGCSAYFMGGVVAYSNSSKVTQLGVKEETLEQYGAVSEQTAKEMAKGAREKLKTTYGIAVTGIAGPGGAVPGKPVGTIWLGYADKNGEEALLLNLSKNRLINIQITAIQALNLLRKKILAKSE